MAPPRAIPILCQIKCSSVQVSYLWFPGGYNDFNSDVSKQIRLCTGSVQMTYITADSLVNLRKCVNFVTCEIRVNDILLDQNQYDLQS